MMPVERKDISDKNYQKLIDQVGTALRQGRATAHQAVNSAMVKTYWSIGQYIVEYEQAGNERAEYGSDLLRRLSRDLTERYGEGFSQSNINKMRKFYICYPILQTVSAKLTWSHYIELLKLDDAAERSFYAKEAIASGWSVRELKRQMQSMLYHRLALSTDKQQVMRLAAQGQIIERPEDILKDPYV